MEPDAYRDMLTDLLGSDTDMSDEGYFEFTIAELEEAVLNAGKFLPIVRLPEHYHRGKKWFTNLGDVDMCNCGAKWPCPDPIFHSMCDVTDPCSPECTQVKPNGE